MNTTLNNTRLPKSHCVLYRVFACILLGVSLVNLIAIFRYYLKQYYNAHKSFILNRLSPIMIGMSISSLLITFTATPFIIAQCISCRPSLNHEIFCKMHGFICFSTGIFNM